jgi:hypothetical protein
MSAVRERPIGSADPIPLRWKCRREDHRGATLHCESEARGARATIFSHGDFANPSRGPRASLNTASSDGNQLEFPPELPCALRSSENYGTQLFVLHFKIQTGLPFFSAGRSRRTSYGWGSLSQLKV